MAQVRNKVVLTFQGTFTLNETEMRALDALVGYGDDAFLEVFGEKLGQYYMRDHKKGLKSFFDAVRSQVLPQIRDIDAVWGDLDAMAQRRMEEKRNANIQTAESDAGQDKG